MPVKKKAASTKSTVKSTTKKTKIKKSIATKKVDTNTKLDPAKTISNKIKTSNGDKKIYYFIGAIILLIIVFALIILSQNKIGKNPMLLTGSTNPIVDNSIVKTGATIKIDYVGRLEDGTIFDSSIEEFAKKTANYSSGRTYRPVEFAVGLGQMIKGLDQGVIGMKLGEKKTLTILPKDAYGEKIINQDVPKQYFDDVITNTVAIENFQDVITKTFPKNLLGEDAKNLKEGQEIEAGAGIKGKITKIEGDNVTMEIQNTQNPFYGKKLVEGLKTTFQGNDIVVTKVTTKDVTITVTNKQNPFYGKKLIEGLVGKLSNGQEIKIIKIDTDTINIQMENPDKLAGKTLTFDIEIKEIK